MESATRSVFKALSWRVLATTDTFLISWFVTGTWQLAGAIAGIEVSTKMALYILHERVWNKITYGKDTEHGSLRTSKERRNYT